MDERAEIIRTMAGVIVILTLMILMIMSFQDPTRRIPDRTFQTLLILISALLGLDMVRERASTIQKVAKAAMEAYIQSSKDDE